MLTSDHAGETFTFWHKKVNFQHNFCSKCKVNGGNIIASRISSRNTSNTILWIILPSPGKSIHQYHRANLLPKHFKYLCSIWETMNSLRTVKILPTWKGLIYSNGTLWLLKRILISNTPNTCWSYGYYVPKTVRIYVYVYVCFLSKNVSCCGTFMLLMGAIPLYVSMRA